MENEKEVNADVKSKQDELSEDEDLNSYISSDLESLASDSSDSLSDDHEERPTGHNKSKVKFPLSGKRSIYDPAPKDFKVGVTPHLQKLTKKYYWSKHEFELVKNDFLKSILSYHMTKAGITTFEVKRIEKVVNGFLWKNYTRQKTYLQAEGKDINERLLWHGSPFVDDMLTNGFNESYSDTSGMFGAGLYFAKHSSKADRYVFGIKTGGNCAKHQVKSCLQCDRKMLLCRVLMGKVKYVRKSERHSHAPEGFDSVSVIPRPDPNVYEPMTVAYPEYIVYKGEQIYPQYLVTYKLKK